MYKQNNKKHHALFLQVLGIADFENSECFKDVISDEIRNDIVSFKSNYVIALRNKYRLADQLPDEYKKCIKVKETEKSKTEKKPSTSRSYYSMYPPDIR